MKSLYVVALATLFATSVMADETKVPVTTTTLPELLEREGWTP